MQLSDSPQTPAQLLAIYVQSDDSCPLLTGWVLPVGNDDVINTLRRALDEARLSRDLSQAAQVAGTLGLVYFERANYLEARQSLEESITLQRGLVGSDNNHKKNELPTTIGNLAVIDYLLGNANDALTHAREAVELAGNDALTLRGYLLCLVGSILAYVGKYAEASHAFELAEQAFARAEDDLGMAWWQFNQAHDYVQDHNDCARVVQQLEAALPVLREKASPRAVIEALLALADACICQGNLSRASELLKEVEKLITEGKRYWHRPEWYLIKARLAVAEGDFKQATKFAYSALGVSGDQGDLRVLTAIYNILATLLERDRTRLEDAQDALERALSTGRARGRRIHLAQALQQAGLHYKHFANRPTVRARSAGFLYEAERLCADMGLQVGQLLNQPQTTSK